MKNKCQKVSNKQCFLKVAPSKFVVRLHDLFISFGYTKWKAGEEVYLKRKSKVKLSH